MKKFFFFLCVISGIYIEQPEAESFFYGSSANKDHVIWPKALGNQKQAHCRVFIRRNLGILLHNNQHRAATGGKAREHERRPNSP